MAQGSQIANMMQNAPSLTTMVKAECEQRGVPWMEAMMQDTAASAAHIEYSFPEELKFAVKVNLADSKTAYKNLTDGLVDKTAFLELFKMDPYCPSDHGKAAAHPLQPFTDVIKQWKSPEVDNADQ